jgi:hypothetical protein
MQRYDLFISFRASTRSDLARRVAAPRNSTICLLQRLSTRLGFSQGTTAPRRAPRLNSTICLLRRIAPRHSFPQLYASFGGASQRNDLFVNLLSRLDTALGNEPRRNSACRDAQQLNATN